MIKPAPNVIFKDYNLAFNEFVPFISLSHSLFNSDALTWTKLHALSNMCQCISKEPPRPPKNHKHLQTAQLVFSIESGYFNRHRQIAGLNLSSCVIYTKTPTSSSKEVNKCVLQMYGLRGQIHCSLKFPFCTR